MKKLKVIAKDFQDTAQATEIKSIDIEILLTGFINKISMELGHKEKFQSALDLIKVSDEIIKTLKQDV